MIRKTFCFYIFILIFSSIAMDEKSSSENNDNALSREDLVIYKLKQHETNIANYANDAQIKLLVEDLERMESLKSQGAFTDHQLQEIVRISLGLRFELLAYQIKEMIRKDPKVRRRFRGWEI